MRRRVLLFFTLILAFLVVSPASVLAQGETIPVNQGGFEDLQPIAPGIAPGTQGNVVQAPVSQQVVQPQRGGFDLFPIVPCGTRGTGRCTPCGFLDILENIVKFITFGVTGPVAAVLFIYAGFRFMFARGNPNSISSAKRILTNGIYGVAIILLAWIIVVQLIKTIAPGSNADRWYEFNCPEFLQSAGGEPEDLAPVGFDIDIEGLNQLTGEEFQAQCMDPNAIAARQRNVTGVENSAELDQLIQCLIQDPIITEIYDQENIHTAEANDPDDPRKALCQVRRGNNGVEVGTCGKFPCAHSPYSCHYGGRRGTNGAEAVDFNIKTENPDWTCPDGWEITAEDSGDGSGDSAGDSEVVGCRCPTGNWCGVRESGPLSGQEYQIAPGNERALWAELQRAAMENSCTYKLMLLHTTNPHVHVSTTSCDADGGSNVSNRAVTGS